MRPVLVDTGVLVALLDRGDHAHTRCVAALKGVRAPLLTNWPVLTEAMYLLEEVPDAQDALLTWVEARTPGVEDLAMDDVASIRALMRRYRDVPIDFADASLVSLAQRLQIDTVLTLDRHFYTYRLDGRRRFRVIP